MASRAGHDYFAGKRSARPQELEDGWDGVAVDRYAVRVHRWPNQPDGSPGGVEYATRYLRKNINQLADARLPAVGRLATFAPYDPAVDGPLWASATGNGNRALLTISMIDDGSVGVVRASPANWMFKTLTTKNDGTHPVSGNRLFGIIGTDPVGLQEVWFGTRGADRVTDALAAITPGSPVFGTGVPWPIPAQRLLWRSLQKNLLAWINGDGGSATPVPPYEHVYDWTDIENHYIP